MAAALSTFSVEDDETDATKNASETGTIIKSRHVKRGSKNGKDVTQQFTEAAASQLSFVVGGPMIDYRFKPFVLGSSLKMNSSPCLRPSERLRYVVS